jgi:hypothetical protein
METSLQRNTRYEILTPDGWSNFHGIRSILDKDILEIKTKDFFLKCTLDHRIQLHNDFFIEAANLQVGDKVKTKDSVQKILEINFLKKEIVFDPIQVEKRNLYYSNGLVSHNCEFMGSSGTLIAGWKLKELVHQAPMVEKEGLIQYQNVQKDHVYMMVCDVSRGKGLDYSAFQLLDVTKMPYNQVAVFRNNSVTPVDYADTIHRMAKLYNNASVLVEINDIGEQVSHSLHYDFGYENVLFTENAGRSGKRITSGFGNSSNNIDKGIRTTKVVKSIGCSILKLLIEQNQFIINDFHTINELSTFSKKGNSYEAESGKHDDLVMCLVLFAWLSEQQYFKDYTNINTLISLREKTEDDMEQDMAPFGFIDDGREEYDEEIEKFIPESWMWNSNLRDF